MALPAVGALLAAVGARAALARSRSHGRAQVTTEVRRRVRSVVGSEWQGRPVSDGDALPMELGASGRVLADEQVGAARRWRVHEAQQQQQQQQQEQDELLLHQPAASSSGHGTVETRFTVQERLPAQEELILLGGETALGGWDPARGVRLVHDGAGRYEAAVALPRSCAAEFKFARRHVATGQVLYEEGPNRVANTPLRGDDWEVAVTRSPSWAVPPALHEPVLSDVASGVMHFKPTKKRSPRMEYSVGSLKVVEDTSEITEEEMARLLKDLERDL